MLPAGLVKASPAASTPIYYMAWSDAFIAVDFEAITLPLLFSTEETYRLYYSTMRKVHSRKVSEWERMNVHYARARRCYRDGQFVECVTALQHACLLRRNVFVADDYQVGAAYEHAAWAAIHLALIRIGETDGKRDGADDDEADDGDEERHSGDEDDDSEDARQRKNLDTTNPNEIPRLFSIAEELLKHCASAKKRSPFARAGGYNNNMNTTNNNNGKGSGPVQSVGGGVFRGTDISSVAAAAAAAHLQASAGSVSTTTTFPNKTLLEFVLFHNYANYWVRRRKWKAARKYTALAETRYRSLVHKGMVKSDDVVPSLVCGVTAMETFLRCRSELIRLRSQFVAGNALGGGESLLFQKPVNNNPRAIGLNLNGGHVNTSSAGPLGSNASGTHNGTFDSFLSGYSMNSHQTMNGSASSWAGANGSVASISVSQSSVLSHDPLLDRRLLPNTICGDVLAIASELEEVQRREEGEKAGGGEANGVEAEDKYDGQQTSKPKVTPQSILVDGIVHWLRTDKRRATSQATLEAAMATIEGDGSDENVLNQSKKADIEGPSASSLAAPTATPYPYLNQYPCDVPLAAVLCYVEKDATFRRQSHERAMYERLIVEETDRQAKEKETYDTIIAQHEAYADAAKARQQSVDEGVPAASVPALPPKPTAEKPPAPNAMSNMNALLKYENARDSCTEAMNSIAVSIAQKAIANEGFLKFKVWCSATDAPPPSVGFSNAGAGLASQSPSLATTPTMNAHAGGDANNTASEGQPTADGLWCDVAVPFVVAKREHSSPDNWSPLHHTIPFYYHYVSAVLAFNDRKFSLALGHLDRCARIVLATGEEAAPLSKLQAQRRRRMKEEKASHQGSAGEANGEIDSKEAIASPLPSSVEVNPFWWEKGVVTLRHHCIEGPSLDHFSKYNATKKAIHNPIETLQRQIMIEHVTAEQARKRRLLQEEVLRNRMLRDEDGDEEAVDAVDPVTGRPAWAIEPSPAETSGIMNELAEQSDTLGLWRDRRGIVQRTAPSPSSQQHRSDSHESSAVSACVNEPPSSAPQLSVSGGGATAGNRAASNPSSETLQRLTFAQKQAQGRGLPADKRQANAPRQPALAPNSNAVQTAPSSGTNANASATVQSSTRSVSNHAHSSIRSRMALPMLREIASDVLVARRLRRQIHQKQRSGDGGATANNDEGDANTTHPAEASASASSANADVTTQKNTNSKNIFLAVHNVLVDSLLQRQEEQLGRDRAERARQLGGTAVNNTANQDVPAPSSGVLSVAPHTTDGSKGQTEKDADSANETSSRAQRKPVAVVDDNEEKVDGNAKKKRRASLFALEEQFTETRRSLIMLPPQPSDLPATQPSDAANTDGNGLIRVSPLKPIARSQSPRAAPLLSLYGGPNKKHPDADAAGTSLNLPPLDKTPLRLKVAMPTEEDTLEATLQASSVGGMVRKPTGAFGDVTTKALLEAHHNHHSNGHRGLITAPITLSKSPIPSSSVSGGNGNFSAARSSITLSASPMGASKGAIDATSSADYQHRASSPGQPSSIGNSHASSAAFHNHHFRIDAENGAVVGSKRYNLVPHIESIPEKQHALRSMLPSVDFREQRELYRTIMAELAENEEILRLRRVEIQQRVLRHEADKLRVLAVQQQRQIVAHDGLGANDAGII